MIVNKTNYWMARLAHFFSPLLPTWADLETQMISHQLAPITIENPIFISGLARSGTTILLEALLRISEVSTHRYRDFPFIFIPYFWNSFVSRFSKDQELTERAHRDRIHINMESPEAFEEILWRHFFKTNESERILSEKTKCPEFEKCYLDHLKKIILIRGHERYLSKANYNIARIEYLAKLFPSAKFLIPVRSPITHVHSLVKQHQLFMEYSKHDKRVPFLLSAAGHFEFGPQRQPICFSKEAHQQILNTWKDGQEHVGYAISWDQTYRYVIQLIEKNKILSERIRIVKFENLCTHPFNEFKSILNFLKLDTKIPIKASDFTHIQLPDSQNAVPSKAISETIYQITKEVAEQMGYPCQNEHSICNRR